MAERTQETKTKNELAPGNYKFKLLGAKPNPFRAGDTDLDLVVVEGPSAKRRIFPSIPAPHVTKHAAGWAGTLIKALGGRPAAEGESLIDYLNSIAPTANSFTADVIDDSYPSKTATNPDGTPVIVSKAKLMFYSIQVSL